MRNSTGITLVELLVVVSIIGILVLTAGFSFQDWSAAYKAESQIKQIYADLMDARLGAMTRNRSFFIKLEANQYTIYEDSNENGNPDATEILPSFPKSLNYGISWNGSGNKMTFDTRGLLNPWRTIHFTSNIEADYNCIKVSMARINIGKWDEAHTECDAK